jgi:aminopeptidase N
MLREFSAPVKLEDGLSQDELRFLLRHETDGYAQWDAAQRLVLDYVHQSVQKPTDVNDVPKTLISAFQQVLLNNTLDMDLRAELLIPPGFEEAVASLHDVDVSAVEMIRDCYRQQLGLGLYEHALATYERLWRDEDHQMNGQSYGRRSLRNVCLWLMMKANEEATLALCHKQFAQAKTMTDQLAAFGLLVNAADTASRNQAIEQFYKQWSQDDLVLDKWFVIQATSEHPDTLKHVEDLLTHPAFSIKNPNKVRSLIGAFCQGNARNFHHSDGQGYQFLTRMLTTLDQINPQIAARLITPFTRWQRYDAPRRALIYQQLEHLNQLDLSRDVREVVSKSLIVE